MSVGDQMKIENMYRILVATVFILLMTVGIYIGVEITDNTNDSIQNDKDIIVSNTDNIKIYDEQADIIEQEDKLIDVNVKFTDVYPDCGHNIESEEHQQSTTKNKVKEEIQNKDLGYKLIGEQDGILIYQKVHIGKCMNHYKVVLENDTVAIYRIGKTGEFEPYQITEITSNMLREGIKEQLEIGIQVDDIEELFLLMEDIES